MTTIGRLRRELATLTERVRGATKPSELSDQDTARRIAHIFCRGIRIDASVEDQDAAAKIGAVLYRGDQEKFQACLQGIVDDEGERKEAQARRTAMGGIGVIDVTGMA